MFPDGEWNVRALPEPPPEFEDWLVEPALEACVTVTDWAFCASTLFKRSSRYFCLSLSSCSVFACATWRFVSSPQPPVDISNTVAQKIISSPVGLWLLIAFLRSFTLLLSRASNWQNKRVNLIASNSGCYWRRPATTPNWSPKWREQIRSPCPASTWIHCAKSANRIADSQSQPGSPRVPTGTTTDGN